jgi:hypothetical protein
MSLSQAWHVAPEAPIYRRIFPVTRISPRTEADLTTAGGSRLTTRLAARSRGGNRRSDDPLPDAQSESARESLKQMVANTPLSRLDHKSEVVRSLS